MMSPRTSRVWFWALTAVALLYTALLSWWSPLTSDTYHHALTGMEHCFSFSLVWERCVASYMTWNPRIGEYLAFAVATAGKWLFMLLNPFVQVGLALMMFYLASGAGWIPVPGRTCVCSDWGFSCCSRARPGPASRFTGSPEPPTIPGAPPSGWAFCVCTAVCWKTRNPGEREIRKKQ